jgi:hypothetical protein
MNGRDKKKIEWVEKVLDGHELMQAIRPDEHGEVDDVAIHGDLFRLERMSIDSWWCAIYRGDKRVSFSIYKKGKQVVVSLQEDDIGCINDNEELPG